MNTEPGIAWHRRGILSGATLPWHKWHLVQQVWSNPVPGLSAQNREALRATGEMKMQASKVTLHDVKQDLYTQDPHGLDCTSERSSAFDLGLFEWTENKAGS